MLAGRQCPAELGTSIQSDYNLNFAHIMLTTALAPPTLKPNTVQKDREDYPVQETVHRSVSEQARNQTATSRSEQPKNSGSFFTETHKPVTTI